MCSVCIVASVFAALGVRTLQLCFCVVASAFAAVGVRTLQLCFCIVASVYVAVGVRTLKLCFCFVASVFVAVGVRTLQLCSHIVITPKNSNAAPTVIYPTNHMLHKTHTCTKNVQLKSPTPKQLKPSLLIWYTWQ